MKLCAMTMCVLLLAAGGMRARGQWQNGGSMAGQILDGDGAPVEHAQLDIEEMRTGTTYEVHTNGEGRFLLPQLAPGDYRIEVEAPGFAPWAKGGVEVGAGTQVRVSPKLNRVLAARVNPASPELAAHAHAPRVQAKRRQLKRERRMLARLQRQSKAAMAVESSKTSQAQIAEVRQERGSPVGWSEFEPGGFAGSRAGMSARQKLAQDIGAAPKKVHARVTVRTARGTVTADIAEVPLQVPQPGV